MKFFNSENNKIKSRNVSPDTKEALGQLAEAEITVFFALISALIMALFLGVLESARTSAARLHLTVAANSAIDSLFSQYHRELWQNYRILGLEQYDYEQLTDEMTDFIAPYINAKNWFPQRLKDIEITELISITDENGSIFEKEILDYMRYGIAAEIWDIVDLNIFENGRHEGASADKVSDVYSDYARYAVSIEKRLEELSNEIEAEEGYVKGAAEALESLNGSGFINNAEASTERLKKIPEHIKDYEKQADKLKEKLKESREKFDRELENGEISQETWELLNEDISQYESYAREDGGRRQEIVSLGERSSANISFLNGLIEEAHDIMEYIASWESDDEDDELDEEALWRPVIRAMRSYDHLSLGCSFGISDKETEGRLESIKALLSGEMLKLVLPDGADLSSEALNLEESPSSLHSENNISGLGLIERAYAAFYSGAELSYFGRGIYDKKEKKGLGGCELEYVIYGKNSDAENLGDAVSELIRLRTGLNLIYLYKDNTKRGEARTLASAIAGVTGLTPMTAILTFFILSVWALGQAVVDIRNLLSGGSVPFIHTKESFTLSLSGLLGISDKNSLPAPEKSSDEGKGLDYSDYLKVILLADYGSRNTYRIMDIIQMNLREKQKDFRMDRLVYSMQTRVNVYAEHLFSQLGIVKAIASENEKSYNMSVPTAFSY